MIQATTSCHEGEAAERALPLMEQLGVDVLPVTNDNDRVTGVVTAEQLARALRRATGAPRMRDVMSRAGFVVSPQSEPPEALAGRIKQAAASWAVVVDSTGRCVAVVDERPAPAR